MTIEGKTYKIGETIPVTNKNISEFLSGYESALEELRAEIVALYVSIEHLDTLLQAGFMTKWLNLMNKEELRDRLTMGMAEAGISRLMGLSDNATEVTGAHAQANSTITNYLIDNGGMEMVEEPVEMDGKHFTVLGLQFKDRAKTHALIKELMLEVQRIKSTGDTQGVAALIGTYGTKIRNINHPRYLRECREHLVGKVKASVTIYPTFEPVVDHLGQVIDCKAAWPQDFLDGYSKTHPQLIQL
jgi:dipeptidyl-peptidase-3